MDSVNNTKNTAALTLPRYMRWIITVSLFFLVLMSLGRVILFLTAKSQQSPISESIPALLMGIRYDLREVGILGVFMLLLGSIKPFHPFDSRFGKAFWLSLLAVLSTVLVFFYIIDFAHYDYLQQRLNASALGFLQDAQTSFTMVWQTYPVLRILLLIIVLSFLIFSYIKRRYKKISSRPAVANKKAAWLWGSIMFLLLGAGIYGHTGQYPLRWSDAFSLGNDRLAQLALNPFQSFLSSFKYRHSSYDTKAVESYYPYMSQYLGVEQPDSLKLNFVRTFYPASNGRQPNIVLVICESFSAYKSSMFGNPLNPTPFFNTICQQGVFFDHCFTPHFGTARGVWATITGTPDIGLDNTASRNPMIVDQHSIMGDFKDYEKYYFIGGSTSWANIRGLLDNNIKGLHIYEQDKYHDVPKIDVWGISDKNLFLQANKILTQEQKPFFAIIQTADNHRPYTIPKEDRGEFKNVSYPDDSLHKFGFQRNDELNAFRFTDFCFEKFIEAARKEAYFRNTIFVFVGDHGIRGDAGDMFPKAWTDNGLTCFHVPLLFYSPALLAPVRHTMNCSQVDVMPTIAGLANIPYRDATLGRDLMHLSDTNNNVSFVIDHDTRRIGVVSGDYYFTRHLVSDEEALVSIRNNDPLPKNDSTERLRAHMRKTTNAFYESARYLLYHNKK